VVRRLCHTEADQPKGMNDKKKDKTLFILKSLDVPLNTWEMVLKLKDVIIETRDNSDSWYDEAVSELSAVCRLFTADQYIA